MSNENRDRTPHEARADFSTAELRAAFALVMPADDAEPLAQSICATDGMPPEEVIGTGYTADTLALLSLVSDELKAKVETYVRGFSEPHSELSTRIRELENLLKARD